MLPSRLVYRGCVIWPYFVLCRLVEPAARHFCTTFSAVGLQCCRMKFHVCHFIFLSLQTLAFVGCFTPAQAKTSGVHSLTQSRQTCA